MGLHACENRQAFKAAMLFSAQMQRAEAFALFAAVNLYARLRFGRFILLHTNLGRWSGVLAFFAVLGAFHMDTTWLIRITLLGYAISFLECLLIFKLRGPVSPDTRSLFSH